MNNSRMSKKEQGLLKGAMRRVFSRSDLRRLVLDSRDVLHTDPSRPRVKKWSICEVCQKIHPKYTMAVDHVVPLVPLDRSLDEMSWDEVVDRLWCESKNLQVICDSCHDSKTSIERKERNKNKALKRNLDVKPKRAKKSPKKCRPRTTPSDANRRNGKGNLQVPRGTNKTDRRKR